MAHSQANGQVEVINMVIVDRIKKRLEHEKTNWMDELPSVTWATKLLQGKKKTKENPFSMVFENEAVTLDEI